MATLGATGVPSFSDLANLRDSSGKLLKVVELLATVNPIVTDAAVIEANEVTGHTSAQRTGIPAGTWRQLNGGVLPEKSSIQKVRDTLGMLESYSRVDKAMAELFGDQAAYRASEARSHMQGMSRTMATTFFYGNTAIDQEKFMGLAPRFSLLSAQNGGQIVDAGGTGTDNRSIWFVKHGEDYLHMIYPKGGNVGWTHEDRGQQTFYADTTGAMHEVYVDHFKWDIGLVLKDWRHIARIANIDHSVITATGASGPGGASYSGPNLIDLMIEAQHRLESEDGGNLVIYCDSNVLTALDLIATHKTNVWLSTVEYAGRKVTSFRGIPIRRCDALNVNEARVV